MPSAAALLELLGEYLAVQLVLSRLVGLHLVNPLTNFSVGITDAELKFFQKP